MTRDFLRELGIEEDKIDKILDEWHEAAEKLGAPNDKNGEGDKAAILAETYKEQIKELQHQIVERDKQLERLKENNPEELEAQITKLQEENKKTAEDYEQRIKDMKINSAVRESLMRNGAKNLKAVQALLDLDNADLSEDGEVIGLDKQIESLKEAEDSSFLFKTEEPLKLKGATFGEAGDADETSDPSEMTYEEMLSAYTLENK